MHTSFLAEGGRARNIGFSTLLSAVVLGGYGEFWFSFQMSDCHSSKKVREKAA